LKEKKVEVMNNSIRLRVSGTKSLEIRSMASTTGILVNKEMTSKLTMMSCSAR